MHSVYLAIEAVNYEGPDIVAVFASEENAEQCVYWLIKYNINPSVCYVVDKVVVR